MNRWRWYEVIFAALMGLTLVIAAYYALVAVAASVVKLVR